MPPAFLQRRLADCGTTAMGPAESNSRRRHHRRGLLSAQARGTLIMRRVLSRLARDGRLVWPALQEPAGGYVRLFRQSQGRRAFAWPIQRQAYRLLARRLKALPAPRVVEARRPARTPYAR